MPENVHNIEIKPTSSFQTVSFTDSNGETQTKKLKPRIATLFEKIKEYSGDNNPNITPDELFQMNEKMYSVLRQGVEHYGNGAYSQTELSDYKTLIEHYTGENSPGGKDITPKEQKLLMEKYAKWYDEKY